MASAELDRATTMTSDADGGYSVPGMEAGDATTRAKLLASARRIFDRLGWNKATVEDIVKDAGVSRGSFYVYFDNKRAIFNTLITSMMDDLYARAEARRPGDSIFARLEAGNRAFLEVWDRDRDLMRNVTQLAWLEPGVDQMQRGWRNQFIARTQAAIERHQQAGITHDIDPRLAAAALAGMVESFATRHYVHDEPEGANYPVAEMSYMLTALWYRSIYNESAPPLPPMDAYLSGVGADGMDAER